VTAAASKDQVRFTALALTREIQLEVLSSTGEPVYNSGRQPGNRLEWVVKDQQGSGLRDGVYGCVVTVADLYGQVSYRRAILRVMEGVVAFQDTANEEPAAAASDEQESLTILRADKGAPFTLVSHDGREGWVESASGGLSFYAGSLSRIGDSVPHLRITPEGNLGIGVADPAAKLDVAGRIRASEGFQFSDGTILKMEAGLPVLVMDNSTASSLGNSAGVSAATATTAIGKTAGKTIRVLAASGGAPSRVFGLEDGPPLYNTLYGLSAGSAITTGHDNSFFGYSAGLSNTTGYFNSFFGQSAGLSNTTESNNSFIGAYSDGATGITNATAFGYRAKVTQSNSLVLGSINGINSATADTKVGIGTTAPVSHLNVTSSSTVSPRGVTNEQYNNGMDGVQFRGRKARGTPASPAALQSGDVLGNYVFDGHDGAAFGTGVQIRPVAEESWSPTAHGAYLALWTTPPGSTTNTEKMRITGSGNVGIGTSSPAEKLHVIGNIRVSGTIIYGAPEEAVPDYVFEPDYKLMPMDELQRFLTQEKHLPNLPNAAQITEKGLNLGQFQMKLLEKIEELTLYTVQQSKAIGLKDAKITALEEKNNKLEARLATLEQMIDRLTDLGKKK
jgi:hypothetical protein